MEDVKYPAEEVDRVFKEYLKILDYALPVLSSDRYSKDVCLYFKDLDTKLSEYQFDSLDVVTISMEIENRFDILFPDEDVEEILGGEDKTNRDVVNYILSKIYN